MFTLKLFVAIGVEFFQVFRLFEIGALLWNARSVLIVDLVQFCLVIQRCILLIDKQSACIVWAIRADINVLSRRSHYSNASLCMLEFVATEVDYSEDGAIPNRFLYFFYKLVLVSVGANLFKASWLLRNDFSTFIIPIDVPSVDEQHLDLRLTQTKLPHKSETHELRTTIYYINTTHLFYFT